MKLDDVRSGMYMLPCLALSTILTVGVRVASYTGIGEFVTSKEATVAPVHLFVWYAEPFYATEYRQECKNLQ